jgi:hypothetical protein
MKRTAEIAIFLTYILTYAVHYELPPSNHKTMVNYVPKQMS